MKINKKYMLDIKQPKESALWEKKETARARKAKEPKKDKDLAFRNRLKMKEKYGESKTEV